MPLFRRITPARAGTTTISRVMFASARDHPRSRGYHFVVVGYVFNQIGSPPLARVPLCGFFRRQSVSRITPARAGTTVTVDGGGRLSVDHPRSRGYHRSPFRNMSRCWGSPPLARVPPESISSLKDLPGITPARAGTTDLAYADASVDRDHPRSRGYHPSR